MKTTKLTAVAIAIAFTAATAMAQTESVNETAPGPNVQTLTISLKAALQNRGLVYAMRTQLNPSFLLVEKRMYTVPVKFNKGATYVTGTFTEWSSFFRTDDDVNAKISEGNRIHLKEAMLEPRLVSAMHAQLTPALLREEKPVYTAAVRINHTIVYVFANYKEWKWFFRVDDVPNPLGS